MESSVLHSGETVVKLFFVLCLTGAVTTTAQMSSRLGVWVGVKGCSATHTAADELNTSPCLFLQEGGKTDQLKTPPQQYQTSSPRISVSSPRKGYNCTKK